MLACFLTGCQVATITLHPWWRSIAFSSNPASKPRFAGARQLDAGIKSRSYLLMPSRSLMFGTSEWLELPDPWQRRCQVVLCSFVRSVVRAAATPKITRVIFYYSSTRWILLPAANFHFRFHFFCKCNYWFVATCANMDFAICTLRSFNFQLHYNTNNNNGMKYCTTMLTKTNNQKKECKTMGR